MGYVNISLPLVALPPPQEDASDVDPPELNQIQPETTYTNVQEEEISQNNGKLSPTKLAELWNNLKPPSLPKVVLPINSKRIKKAQLALKTRADPIFWESLIRSMAESPFLLGANDRGWKADFDFVLEKYDRIFEGKYLTETRVSAITIKNMQAGKEWLAEDRKYG